MQAARRFRETYCYREGINLRYKMEQLDMMEGHEFEYAVAAITAGGT